MSQEDKLVACVCGEPSAQDIQHRTDGPCFSKPVAAQEPGPSVAGIYSRLTCQQLSRTSLENVEDVLSVIHANAAPCARCSELEAEFTAYKRATDLAYQGSELEAQAKITEQAERIRVLEKEDTEIPRLKDATINMQSEKLASANAVIQLAKPALEIGLEYAKQVLIEFDHAYQHHSSVENERSVISQGVSEVTKALAAIAAYEKGEEA